ncbi:Chromosomal replication initiator protein DnaA [Anatilimnocola aggregata]|uniref:Chromosomal replication initiator protein DnaA n=1 Tax=Anatilimnocola aggregata TaxID=2528021 RepID=A0A517Y425_9BACT|nr:Chromosomal replication initiator protein DnaA [Anatilimnocola aggregata]
MISGTFTLASQSATGTASSAAGTASRARASGTAAEPLLFGPENGIVRRLETLVHEPQPAFNPLVFCGSSGTGKTSLAMLLVDLRAQHLQTTNVFRTTGADFARAASHALETDSVAEYRSRMGRADIVLIDELQRLANRAAPLEELQNRLDGWLRRGSLVVVTMKTLPVETAGLSPGVISRLSAGLCVPLLPPEQATRAALLAHYAEREQLTLSTDARERLVQRTNSTPAFLTAASLRHALLQLAHLSSTNKRPIDEALVDELLADHLPDEKATLRQIVTTVAKHFEISLSALKGDCRQRNLVMARGVVVHLARQLTSASFATIGELLGKRDHTTILHSARKIVELIDLDPELRQHVEHLRQQLTATEVHR